MRKWSNEDLNESKQSGQSTIDSTTRTSHLVIVSYIPGEGYTFSTDSLAVRTNKISASIDWNKYCNIESDDDSYSENVQLSDQFIGFKSYNGTENMDCTLMITNDNLYILSLASNTAYFDTNNTVYHNYNHTSFESNFILVDVTTSSQVYMNKNNESSDDTL